LNAEFEKSNSEGEEGLTLFQRQLVQEAQAAVAELEEIKSSRTWRLIRRLWGFPPYLKLRGWIVGLRKRPERSQTVDHRRVVLRALGQRSPTSHGSEVWALKLTSSSGAPISYDQVQLSDGFERRPAPDSPMGEVLFAHHTGNFEIDPPAEGLEITLLTHPWSGQVEIGFEGRRMTLDLFSETAGELRVALPAGTVVATSSSEPILQRFTHVASDAQVHLLPQDQQWIEAVRAAAPPAVAVLHPDWLGIRSASLQHFDHVLWVEDDVEINKAFKLAHMLGAAGCQRVVFSGFAVSHRHIVSALKKVAPQVNAFVLWHGNFLQTREDYNWMAYQEALRLAQRGEVYKLGFVKQGLAEDHARQLGLHTGFVMNFMEQIPERPSDPMPGGPHLGLWSIWSDNWRKPPYAALVAAARIPGAVVHGSHASERVQSFCKLMGVEAEFLGEPLPQERMPETLSGMHLNLYITLSECAPMMPLESLAVGVPCLTGPTSHLFEDDDYLRSRLVVPYPDQTDVIAEAIQRALAERSQIVESYRDYARDYNQRAKRSMRDFLEIGGDD
jgi:hypothetical protein